MNDACATSFRGRSRVCSPRARQVFRQYAERLGHGMDDLSFVADGKEVHPETTPDRLTEAPLPKSDRVITHDDVPGFPCAQMCMPGNLFGGQHSGIEGRGTD